MLPLALPCCSPYMYFPYNRERGETKWQRRPRTLPGMKEEIMRSMVNTLAEIAVAQGGAGRNEMVTGGALSCS